MRTITYKEKPATLMAELSRRHPVLDRFHNVVEPGAVYCQLNVDGQEVFDWIDYEQLYDIAGNLKEGSLT